MSTHLASVGPLLRRGFPFPGRLLLVFDDLLVEVRASGLANAHVVGGDSGNLLADLLGPLILAGARLVGRHRNQALLEDLTPDEMARADRMTWSASASAVIDAVLSRPRGVSGNRRLLIRTREGQRVFQYDSTESPDDLVSQALVTALGDRFRSTVKA